MLRNLKNLLAIVLILVLVLGSLAGCGGQTKDEPKDTQTEQKADTGDDAAKEDEEFTVGFVVMNLFMTWMAYAAEGSKQAAEAEGINLVIYNAENKADKQVSLIEDLIAQKVDAIITNPIDVNALVPALEEADKAGIPVLTFDRRAEGAPYFAFVGSDDKIGGRLAAKYIAEKLGGKGKVIELVGALGASPTIDRGDNFHKEFKENYPDIEIVYSQSGEFVREKGMKVMEDAITATGGEFDAVFSHNDDMMMGALQAMKDANIDLSKVVTISYDGVPDALKAIKNGEHDATIQYPVGQAPLAMKVIAQYLKEGKEPEKKDDKIDPWVITIDNLETGDFYPELQK